MKKLLVASMMLGLLSSWTPSLASTPLEDLMGKYQTKPAQTPAPKAKPKKQKPGATIGMTKKQVLNDTNWGKPASTRRKINEDGTWDFWYYNSCDGVQDVFTFLDGELVEMEVHGD